MGPFWGYLGGTVFRPRETFRRLAKDPRAAEFGAEAILLIGVLYTLTVIGLWLSRVEISTPAWLAIPADRYYFWQIFFAIPVMVLGWILAAGLLTALGRGLGGSGSFEGSMGVLGFALAVPTFITWIPETIGTILYLTGTMTQAEFRTISAQPGFLSIFTTVYQYIALAWMLFLTLVSAAAVHTFKWWKAAAAGLLTLVVFMTAMLVFIR